MALPGEELCCSTVSPNCIPEIMGSVKLVVALQAPGINAASLKDCFGFCSEQTELHEAGTCRVSWLYKVQFGGFGCCGLGCRRVSATYGWFLSNAKNATGVKINKLKIKVRQ